MQRMEKVLAIKIDVDTDRGTRIGVPNLIALFAELGISATFLFSLGPDNTGRAIKRIFRPGFLKKVSRSSVVSVYGVRTLLNGTLLPAPHIGKRHGKIMVDAYNQGHEVGIHCYDHIRWQDYLHQMSFEETKEELDKARHVFEQIFGFPARTAGAAGWQANANSLAAYDQAHFTYASDARGAYPFMPRIDGKLYHTLQIPTTLPTLDELLGRPEYPLSSMARFYLDQLSSASLNVLTIHAELEGMKYIDYFAGFLQAALAEQVQFIKLEEVADALLVNKDAIPVCDLIQGEIDGRSGTLAVQVIK